VLLRINLREFYMNKIDLKNGVVDMSHGGGGKASSQLIEQIFFKYFANEMLLSANDQASFAVPAGRMSISTDSHVISPLIFPGGDIGSLSVHGTLNDVAMSGAKPLYMSAGFILEEGLKLSLLDKIVRSMGQASVDAGVPIITGDTKVVEAGHGDGIFINTTAIGLIPDGLDIGGDKAQIGDKIIISGSIGDHGTAIMSSRENLEFGTTIQSDSAALHGLIGDMVKSVPQIHCLRDPTRGGLATTLNEFSRQSDVGIDIVEHKIPVKIAVKSACELLGLDPMYIANEGKLVCIVPANKADQLLKLMQNHKLGKDAKIIGEVVDKHKKMVTMQTTLGGRRIVDYLTGDQLPRIC
jgi:hydrogenase expression/formation protein HypE